MNRYSSNSTKEETKKIVIIGKIIKENKKYLILIFRFISFYGTITKVNTLEKSI